MRDRGPKLGALSRRWHAPRLRIVNQTARRVVADFPMSRPIVH